MTETTAPTALPRRGAALEALAAHTTEAEFTRLTTNALGVFAQHLRTHNGDHAAAFTSFHAANGLGAALVLADLLDTMAAAR